MREYLLAEAEWAAATSPGPLLMHLDVARPETGSLLRRTRLVLVACCRHLPPDLLPAGGAAHLDAIEGWVEAGGRMTPAVVRGRRPLFAEVERLEARRRAGPRARRLYEVASAVHKASITQESTFDRALVIDAVSTAADAHPRPTARRFAADIVRCVFGNPFRPTAYAPGWRTATAVAIATAAYADRAFDRLPVLADALEDAGCDSVELLAHLRGPGPHARGCWAVDAVLGKG